MSNMLYCSVHVGILFLVIGVIITGDAGNFTSGRSSVSDEILVQLINKYDQNQYFQIQKNEIVEGDGSYEVACQYCKKINGDMNRCFARCITEDYPQFSQFSDLIADTMKAAMCKPLGFKFGSTFFGESEKSEQLRRSFKSFSNEVERYQSSFPFSTLTEHWLWNLFRLRPLVLYGHIKEVQTNVILDREQIDESITPQAFARRCDTVDLSHSIDNLVATAKDKPHALDILLKGLFAVRSAAHYTSGGPQKNLGGAMLEGLDAFIGRKCDVVALQDEKTTCDEWGQYPNPGLPIPDKLQELVQCI